MLFLRMAIFLFIVSCTAIGNEKDMLIGRWAIEFTHADHALKKTVEFQPDGTHLIIMESPGKEPHREKGTWEVKGDTLITNFKIQSRNIVDRKAFVVRQDSLIFRKRVDGLDKSTLYVRDKEP
ncbi:MAG: hypothetical protein GKR89_33695 [Candidatus Latescibacteria bacterium]|nr:hypothetical protein [Candidatus Latescibacterota bacterium]